MKLNPFKLLDPDYKQDDKDASKYDESVLQQGRFWMRTVTWSLIGTTVFGIAWLAIARTEEIVVAKGQLEPVGSVQDIQMPVGGVVDDILVEEGDVVKVQPKGERTFYEARVLAANLDGTYRVRFDDEEEILNDGFGSVRLLLRADMFRGPKSHKRSQASFCQFLR